MWNFFMRLFGWVEHEFEDIVADFGKVERKLGALVNRKMDDAEYAREEAERHTVIAVQATQDAAKAAAVQANIQAIIDPDTVSA